jgi:hypothetical protein
VCFKNFELKVQSQSHAPTEKENAAAMMEEFDGRAGK